MIIRSAFWLGAAFILLGPQADLMQGAQGVADQAVGLSVSAAQTHVSSIECAEIGCTIQKSALIHGLDLLGPSDAQPAPQLTGRTVLPPIPQAPIDRSL